MPHLRLLQKIESCGICGKPLEWIRSFLTGRRQRVKVKGRTSAWIDVSSGVPQGSVFGPILFVIYINDIIDNLKCNAYLYADDMKIYTRIINESDRQKLQEDINTIVDWTKLWLLKLNISKCKVLNIGTHDATKFQYLVTMDGKTSILIFE